MVKRAFALYNDNANCGVNVVAELDVKVDWRSLDQDMEDSIGDLKTVKEVQDMVRSFPEKFGQAKFIKAKVYSKFNGSMVDTVTLAPENEYQVSQQGYRVNNPNMVEIAFQEA